MPLRSTAYYSSLPSGECTAYYSKLGKAFAVGQLESQQFTGRPRLDDAYYAAPEVRRCEAVDMRKALAFSFGVMLYEALTRMLGMSHAVTEVRFPKNTSLKR